MKRGSSGGLLPLATLRRPWSHRLILRPLAGGVAAEVGEYVVAAQDHLIGAQRHLAGRLHHLAGRDVK